MALLIFQVRFEDDRVEQFIASDAVDAVRQARASRPGVEVQSSAFVGRREGDDEHDEG